MAGPQAVAFAGAAAGVQVGGSQVLAGTTSWADRSLVADGSFYPSRSLTAAERLSYYARRLPLTEVATTYRFPPTPEVSQRWAALTPPGFTMDVRAWSLLSGAPTWPESLWPDLQRYMRPPRTESAKLYRGHLPDDVVEECWERFLHSIKPLKDAGRLGAVTFHFPSWFKPRPTSWEELAALQSRTDGFEVAVQLASERWLEGGTCEQTLGFLEELGLGFVVQVEPDGSAPVVAATSDVAIVRFNGRRYQAWEETRAARGQPEEAPARAATSAVELPGPAPDEVAWWSYRYSDEELQEWAPAIRELASCTSEVHVVMDNSWKCDAVDNAAKLLDLLAD